MRDAASLYKRRCQPSEKYQFSWISVTVHNTTQKITTMFAYVLGFALVAAASADKAPVYGAPPPAPAYAPAPAYKPAPVYKEEAKPYSYQYGVADDYSGARFSANENSDAKVVTGSYTVHLPDGRVQTVTYTADHYNGYVADVKVRNFVVFLHS